MNEQRKKQTIIILVLAVVVLFGLFMLLHRNTSKPINTAAQSEDKTQALKNPAARSKAKTGKPKKTATPSDLETDQPKNASLRSNAKAGIAPFNIDGHRIGMSVAQVKQQLNRRKVSGFQTGFSDLFVYDPSPDSEIKLQFTCSAQGNILGRVEFTTLFTAEETEAVLPKFKEQLVARYGLPTRAESQPDRLDFCWGPCEQGASGAKLTALTTAAQGNKRALALTLSDDALIQACAEMRPQKINNWLYQWIDAVQEFKLGMPLRDASALYEKRYQRKLDPDEERDEAAQQYAVTNYVVKDHDFFTTLDFESQAFEGAGLGTIVLKFTGGQAGKDSVLNKKLYYASLSTTKFTDRHVYADVKQKLDRFVKVYGTPAEVVPHPGGITARWQHDAQQRSVSIFDSGLITFEQSDPALKDAYRDAAVRKIGEYHNARFDRPMF